MDKTSSLMSISQHLQNIWQCADGHCNTLLVFCNNLCSFHQRNIYICIWWSSFLFSWSWQFQGTLIRPLDSQKQLWKVCVLLTWPCVKGSMIIGLKKYHLLPSAYLYHLCNLLPGKSSRRWQQQRCYHLPLWLWMLSLDFFVQPLWLSMPYSDLLFWFVLNSALCNINEDLRHHISLTCYSGVYRVTITPPEVKL